MDRFFILIKKHWITIKNLIMLLLKVVLFFYILYAFNNGLEDIAQLIAVLVSAGLILIPIKVK